MVKGIDYKKVALQKRNLQKEFHGNRLWSAHVVGKAVELALRKSYRPAVGALPVPVHLMGSTDLEKVHMPDVLKPGNQNPSTVPVEVYPDDAQLAISITKAILRDLQGLSWHLQVLTVDHQGPGCRHAAHDLIMQADPQSRHAKLGLFSVEIH